MRNTQLHPTFNAVFEQVKSVFELLDKQKKEVLIRQLDHGRTVISTNEQLNAYLYRYGRIHEAKLGIALEYIPNKLWSEGSISIIDYGCGQGIAEIERKRGRFF